MIALKVLSCAATEINHAYCHEIKLCWVPSDVPLNGRTLVLKRDMLLLLHTVYFRLQQSNTQGSTQAVHLEELYSSDEGML
jgi:hypothetical protein